jgi:hypothetical protein
MNRTAILLLIATTAALFAASTDIPQRELAEIGRKVWHNECGGTVEGLTSWNTGETFPSLGIGHFIWYPKGQDGPFEESFPKLLAKLQRHGIDFPAWLHPDKDAPWQTRAEFQRDIQGARIRELRALLARTVDLQTEFLAERMDAALPKMLEAAPAKSRDHIRRQFLRLRSDPRGLYALIDYVNFKGEGTKETERYKGHGWGLLQVLEQMDPGTPDAPAAFARAAAQVLTRRVANSPPERNEARWLPGWKARTDSYAR